MVDTHVIHAAKDRTYVYIPSFLRKMFKLTKESKLDITTDGKSIIITPKE
jgi:hypothetical protein